MPDYTGTGQAAGAAIGTAVMPGVGTMVGGALGGMLGGALSSQDKMPYPIQAPAPVMPGAVSGTYGGMYRDPVTGQVYFTDTSMQGMANPQYWQNAALYNQLMGGQGMGAAGSQLDAQVNQLQAQLQAAQAQKNKSVDIKQFVDNAMLDPTGKVIDISNPNSISRSSPIFHEFMQNTGGSYGSSNRDISFGKWLKDYYNRNVSGQIGQYQNALKEQEGNKAAVEQQIAALQGQLGMLQNAKGAYTQGASGSAQNPLLAQQQQLDQYAQVGGGVLGNYLNQQTALGQDQAIRAARDQAARRGLASSGIDEMTQARMRMEGQQALNQNRLQSMQFGQNATQQALASRLGLLGFASGQQQQALGNQINASNAGLNQLGLGYNVTANAAGATNNWNMANVGMQNQYNMANYNAQQLQQQNRNNQMGSAMGGLGYYYGSQQPMSGSQIAAQYGRNPYASNFQPVEYASIPGFGQMGQIQPMGQSPYYAPDYMRYGTSGK